MLAEQREFFIKAYKELAYNAYKKPQTVRYPLLDSSWPALDDTANWTPTKHILWSMSERLQRFHCMSTAVFVRLDRKSERVEFFDVGNSVTITNLIMALERFDSMLSNSF